MRSPDLIDALSVGAEGWIKEVRFILGVTATDLAKRLRVSQPAVTQLERSELAGTITIERLESIAAAMDCDFVYGFVPRESFQKQVDKIEAKQNAARARKRTIPRAIDCY